MTLIKKANIAFLIFITGYFCYLIFSPLIAVQLWGEEYKQAMFSCDRSMREHFIAKKATELYPNEINIKNLQASELGLLTCHDYDKRRKKMIMWGLDQDDLSMLGLETMEEKAYDLRTFVETHEFKY